MVGSASGFTYPGRAGRCKRHGIRDWLLGRASCFISGHGQDSSRVGPWEVQTQGLERKGQGDPSGVRLRSVEDLGNYGRTVVGVAR
jgi:hypothetical protein